MPFRSSGDNIADRLLADAGGKEFFVKELDEALAEGRVDLAVHSMKDVPGTLPDGLVIAAALPRDDARYALIRALSIAKGPGRHNRSAAFCGAAEPAPRP